MELVCGQLLQEELRCNQKVWFNQGTKHKALSVKGVFEKFQKIIDWRNFKYEKQKKKGTCYNYGIKGHFAKKYHKNKQDWKNKFKGSSQITTISKTCSKKKII
jgi:hypothetical protein